MMEAAETEIHPMRGLGLGSGYSVARTLTTLNVEAHSTEGGNTYLKYTTYYLSDKAKVATIRPTPTLYGMVQHF